MNTEKILDEYVRVIRVGDRAKARDIIRKAIATGNRAEDIYRYILFPAMEQIENLFRADEISILERNLAVRINRFITDQVQAQLIPQEKNGKIAVIICAEAETEELGGQMCADLLESAGWDVFFLGGGVPEDEVTEFIGKIQPDVLVIYGSKPSGVPLTRQLITRIRDIGACPTMNVLVTGGIFNRVEGLWEEIQADLFAYDPVSVVEVANDAEPKVHLPRNPNAPKRRRRLIPNTPITVN